jgi:tetratricopeptide (TPR) repeat protein
MHAGVRRVFLTPILVLLMFVSVVASDWNRGVARYNKGDYRAALAEFQDIVLEKPESAGAWYYIGLCEFKMKRYDRVELPLSRAISLLEIQSPESADIPGAWYTIGISHYLLTHYDKAVEPLKQYLSLSAKAKREIDPSARAALGRSYYFLERYDEAIAMLSAPVSANDKSVTSSAYYLGAIHFKREDDDRAIAALREAIKANSDDPAALELLAESLMRKAQKANTQSFWDEAAQVGEKLKSVRNDIRTAGILGRAYLGARQFEKASHPLEKIAKAEPENGQVWLYYGVALSRSGQLRKAMEALEITIQLLPESVPALSELGYVYESDKQYQQALRVLEKAYAVKGDPAIKESIERVRLLAQQQPL